VDDISVAVRSIVPGAQEKWVGVETVHSILANKGSDIWSVEPEVTVYDAIALMADKGIGALLVMKERRLIGILSERDYARKVILQGRSSKETRVADIMTAQVLTVGPDATVYDCLAIIANARVRHLPVLDDGLVVGLVSIGDLVNSILSMQAHTIDQLHTYIASNYPT
jgi:signal-transduction protein with cAMP-binding, CBS, and nucleotidyltransferase domain